MERSRRYIFTFPVFFALTYVLMTQSVWLPLKGDAISPGNYTWGDHAFIFGIWRILSLLVLFILCMPFIPAIRQWEAPVVGALTGVVVSVNDWLLDWGTSPSAGGIAIVSMFAIPMLACILIVVFLRYAENHISRRPVVR
jgi:hypothetical protein